jgi:hypothetical protein
MGMLFSNITYVYFVTLKLIFPNRFIMFNNYCIPKESLLSKTGDINDNGQYISPFKNKSKRLGNNTTFIITSYLNSNYIKSYNC